MQCRKFTGLSDRFVRHPYLPFVLAIFSTIFMLPSLKTGLIVDDFVQRTALVKRSQLPQRLLETGAVPDNPGSLSTALFETFGFTRNRQRIQQSLDHGLLPWWTLPDLKACLWRPFTAFTHWLDYRLFPDLPALMHLHSILWFAAIVFVVAILYRRLIIPTWVAGFAALLFLLDENTYFPVAFIANRGFLISIFFATLALLAHHKWRNESSVTAAVVAPFFFVLSLLSNEAGVTTFAYLLAYEIALDRTEWHKRALSLVPTVLTIIAWRLIYNALGYGVYGIELYVDPVSEPSTYISLMLRRIPFLLMGQLTWQTPDLMSAVSNSIRTKFLVFSVVFLAVTFLILLPVLRRNRLARFWFIAMIFSAVPLSTVSPMSKNLPLMAVAAFGLIAVFIYDLFSKQSCTCRSSLRRMPAWFLCIMFLIVHIPLPAAGRILAPKMSNFAINMLTSHTDLNLPPELYDKNIVVVNAPSPVPLLIMPFERAYNNQTIPRSIHVLAPGFRPIQVTTVDSNTLIVKTKEGNLFSCEQESPLHVVYFFEQLNLFRSSQFPFQPGDRISLSLLTVEVIATDGSGQPKEVSFSFNVALADSNLCWLQFDWRELSYLPLEPPPPGRAVDIAGPPTVSLKGAAKHVARGLFHR